MRLHSILAPAGILGALLLGPVVCAAGEADVAAVLPPRTVAYLRLSNFSRLLDGLRDEDKKEPLLGFTTGLGLLDELTVKASEKMLAQIRAVHLSLHRLTISPQSNQSASIRAD